MHSKKKSTIQTDITTVNGFSHDGRGIGDIKGKKIFLFNALPNEVVKFKYKKQRSRFAEGDVFEVLENPSEIRVDPNCNHFIECGGCQIQHLNYSSQVQLKEKILLEILTSQGLKPNTLLPSLLGKPWNYRRKARLSVKYDEKRNKTLLGFRERSSHSVSAISHCSILEAKIADKLEMMNEVIDTLTIRSYIPQIELSITEKDSVIILRHLQPLTEDDKKKLITFCQYNDLTLFLQPNSIHNLELLYPKDKDLDFCYVLENNIKLNFQPLQFIQVNAVVNQKMVNHALALLNLKEEDEVLDLFCGIGNFSLPIALKTKKVVGIELDSVAVSQAKENATSNKIFNTEFYCNDLFSNLWQPNWNNKIYNKIVLDPPRSGAMEICQAIQRWKPSVILYISCNPATLARDSTILVDKGYQLDKLTMIDMFPQTKHIEAMALFTNEKN